MESAEICKSILGRDKLSAVLEELFSAQVKAVLKQGDVRVKLPAGYVSQQKRRRLFADRIMSEIEQNNQELAGELLQQWLLHRRRPLLIAFLDRLKVKHTQGETDETFLINGSSEEIRAAAGWLREQFDPVEVAAYLAFVAHQQRSTVLDGWEGLRPATAAMEEPPLADNER